jgi:RNA recognition motif-containing protein
MVKRLYVGNMSYDTTEDTLRALFAGVGEVESVNLITDRGSGRSKGFGFVEMATEEEAQAAISQFNGTTLDDREVTVAEARPQRPRSDRGGGGGGGGRRGRGSSWDY